VFHQRQLYKKLNGWQGVRFFMKEKIDRLESIYSWVCAIEDAWNK